MNHLGFNKLKNIPIILGIPNAGLLQFWIIVNKLHANNVMHSDILEMSNLKLLTFSG